VEVAFTSMYCCNGSNVTDVTVTGTRTSAGCSASVESFDLQLSKESKKTNRHKTDLKEYRFILI
jgi:hypothetical protein